MTAKRRKFTQEEKLHILQLANQLGTTKVLREYKLSYSVFSRWKDQMGMGTFTKADADLLELRQENIRLKRIVADQALELEMKREQLRKG